MDWGIFLSKKYMMLPYLSIIDLQRANSASLSRLCRLSARQLCCCQSCMCVRAAGLRQWMNLCRLQHGCVPWALVCVSSLGIINLLLKALVALQSWQLSVFSLSFSSIAQMSSGNASASGILTSKTFMAVLGSLAWRAWFIKVLMAWPNSWNCSIL